MTKPSTSLQHSPRCHALFPDEFSILADSLSNQRMVAQPATFTHIQAGPSIGKAAPINHIRYATTLRGKATSSLRNTSKQLVNHLDTI